VVSGDAEHVQDANDQAYDTDEGEDPPKSCFGGGPLAGIHRFDLRDEHVGEHDCTEGDADDTRYK